MSLTFTLTAGMTTQGGWDEVTLLVLPWLAPALTHLPGRYPAQVQNQIRVRLARQAHNWG